MIKTWLTPSRVSALLWLGALAVVVWLTLDPNSPVIWADQDSVAELSFERACVLARATSPHGADGKCRDYTHDPERARLTVSSSEPYTVCFLKAARWFVVDEGPEIDCPIGPPLEGHRITSLDDELRTERRWAEAVRLNRVTAAVSAFPGKLRAVLDTTRSRAWPAECPPLASARIEALDADLIMPTLGSWHFLTGETLETVIEPASYMDRRLDAIERMRRKVPVLVLIDAHVKLMPVDGAPGRLEATASLVDWTTKTVHCQRALSVSQTSSAPQDVQMRDFKVKVSAALADLTRDLTDGGLGLDPTW